MTFNSTDLSTQKNPLPFLDWMRREAPVYHDPDTGVYFVSRDEDIRQVTMDASIFSNVIDPSVFRIVHGYGLEKSDPEVASILKTKGWLLPTTLLLIDAPDHLRYRRLAQEVLSPVAVKQLNTHIRDRVDKLIKQFPSDNKVEFVSEFAKRLPIWVIGSFIFGAPEEDFEQINDWADQFFSTLMPSAPREEYLITVDKMIEMHHYIKHRIDAFREQPDDSVMLSRLLRVHNITGDEPLLDVELMSMMHVLLLAGHDTTKQTLSSCMLELARQPGMFQRLQSNRDHIYKFINEVMRLHPAANVTTRIALHDTEVGGVLIPQGSMVFVAWGSGNRDENAYTEPDRFDMDRLDGKNNLSFGWGPHHCAGAHLARAQLSITLEQILTHFSAIDLGIAEDQLDYNASMNMRSLTKLPIKLTSH